MPELKLLGGPGSPRTIRLPLEQDEWILGTGVSCQVVLEDLSVRDRHARIRRHGVGFTIEPVADDAMVRVNGQDSEGLVPLEPDDEILVGRTRIRFQPGEAFEVAGDEISVDDSIASFASVPRPSGMFAAAAFLGELTADSGAGSQAGLEDVVSGDNLMDSMTQVVAAVRAGRSVPEVALASLATAFGADRVLLFLPVEGSPGLVASFLGPAELSAEDGLPEPVLADACERKVPVRVHMEGQGLGVNEERSLMVAPVYTPEGEGRLVVDAPVSQRAYQQADYVVLAAFAGNLAYLLTAGSQLRQVEKQLKSWAGIQARGDVRPPVWPGLVTQLEAAAPSSKAVLVLGEPCVGKRAAARFLHQLSPRAAEPCMVVDCAVEADVARALFGHDDLETGHEEKGALSLARRGTLVLAHATALPMGVQSRLDSFLSSGEYQSEGDSLKHESEARLVFTSHLDPGGAGGAGWFLDTLNRRFKHYRIVRIPSLRESQETLEAVTRSLLEELSRQRKRAIFDLDDEAWELLRDHPWPGNLIELRLVLAAAVEEAPRDRVDGETLRRYLKPS